MNEISTTQTPLGSHRDSLKGFTLIELMLVLGILVLLWAVAVPVYKEYKNRLLTSRTIADIANFDAQIERYRSGHFGQLPDSLAQLAADTGVALPKDPWGKDYQYLKIEGVLPVLISNLIRVDKNLRPLNVDYDLFSMGPNKITLPAINVGPSLDDIVRANSGSYIGVANDY